jgi:hypothetical protein
MELPVRPPQMPTMFNQMAPPALCPCEGTIKAMMSGQVITPDMLMGTN